MPANTRPRRVSHSKVKDFLLCRWMYHVRHVRGYEPIRPSRAPTLGTAAHVGIAAHLKGENYDEAIANWLEQQPQEAFDGEDFIGFPELAADATRLVGAYLRSSRLDELWTPVNDRKTGAPLIEHKWEVKVPGLGGVVLSGVWDALMQQTESADGVNALWLHEFKLEGSLSEEEKWVYNAQLPIYQHAARMHGYPVVGFMVNQIRSVLPRTPSLTNRGTMSRTKIISDWPTYHQALLTAGLDPQDYEDVREHYEEQAPPFHQVTPVYRSESEVRKTMREVVWPAVYDMLGAKTRIYRSFNFLCPRCSYREPCLTEIKGGDAEEILSAGYTRREGE